MTSYWIQVQGAILAALVGLALIVNIQLRRTRPGAWAWYSALGANLSLWGVLDALLLYDVPDTSILGYLHTVLSVAVPYLTMGFLRKLFNDHSRLNRRVQLILSGFLGIAMLLPLMGIPGFRTFTAEWSHAYVFGSMSLILLLLLQKYQHETNEQERGRMAFVLLPMGAGVLVASISFSPLGINRVYGHLAVLLILYSLYQATIQRTLIDLIALTIKAIHTAVMTAIMGGIFVAIILISRENTGLLVFNIFVASLAVYIVFTPLNANIRDLITRLLSRAKSDLGRALDDIDHNMGKVVTDEDAVNMIIQQFASVGSIQQASIYRLDESRTRLVLMGSLGIYPARTIQARQVAPVAESVLNEGYIFSDRINEELNWFRVAGDESNPRRTALLERMRDLLEQLDANIIILIPGPKGWHGLFAVRHLMTTGNTYTEIQGLINLAGRLSALFEASILAKAQRERERLALLGELSAGLAHEIRNPLGAIRGAAELIEPESMEQREFLDVITEEVDRLEAVMSRFLDFARPLRTRMTGTDPMRVAKKACRLLVLNHEIEVEYHNLIGMTQQVLADEELLTQVFINIIKNSIEARAGRLIIRMEKEEQEDFVMMSFQDNGRGMNEAQLKQVFVPFVTGKSGGTGLGMAVSKKIITTMDGTLDVDSEPDEGTLVTIGLRPTRQTIPPPAAR